MSYRLRWTVEIVEDDNQLHFGAGWGATPDLALGELHAYLVDRRQKEDESQEWLDKQKAKLDSALAWVRSTT